MSEEHIFSMDDYEQINLGLGGLLFDEKNFIANMANAASLLWHSLSDINWAGFYLTDSGGKNLVLGPFQGKPACVRIEYGKGVCGTAVSTKKVQRIADVHAFPGHIACDGASRSEIVIPIIMGDRVVGVLDIDSPVKDRFSIDDEKGLIEFVDILIAKSDI